ncbi:MAG: DUF896 domain-containing protein [Anaerovoracaceae bacterium]
MISKEQIDRINTLAKKAKGEGLTKEEEIERDGLRKEYIASMRRNVKSQLKRVRFVEDMTPEEIAEEKNLKK